MFSFVSITTIAFMTIERYLVVRNSLNSLKISRSLIKGCILFIWLYSAGWMIPEFFAPNGFVLEGFLTHCSFDYISRDRFTRLYMIIIFSFGFFLPLGLIIVLNILIWNRLRSSNKRFQAFKLSNANNNNNNTSNKQSLTSESILVPKGAFFVKMNDLKLIKTLLLMIVIFCVAWAPYAIITLIAQFGSHISNYITPYTTSLPALFAKISTFMNPLIYSLRDKNCRDYLRKMFISFKSRHHMSDHLKNRNIVII